MVYFDWSDQEEVVLVLPMRLSWSMPRPRIVESAIEKLGLPPLSLKSSAWRWTRLACSSGIVMDLTTIFSVFGMRCIYGRYHDMI